MNTRRHVVLNTYLLCTKLWMASRTSSIIHLQLESGSWRRSSWKGIRITILHFFLSLEFWWEKIRHVPHREHAESQLVRPFWSAVCGVSFQSSSSGFNPWHGWHHRSRGVVGAAVRAPHLTLGPGHTVSPAQNEPHWDGYRSHGTRETLLSHGIRLYQNRIPKVYQSILILVFCLCTYC